MREISTGVPSGRGLAAAVRASQATSTPALIHPDALVGEVIGRTDRAQLICHIDFAGFRVPNLQQTASGRSNLGEIKTLQSIAAEVVKGVALGQIGLLFCKGGCRQRGTPR